MSNKYKILFKKAQLIWAIESAAITSNPFAVDVCQIIFGWKEAWPVAKPNIKSHGLKNSWKKSVGNELSFFKIKLHYLHGYVFNILIRRMFYSKCKE